MMSSTAARTQLFPKVFGLCRHVLRDASLARETAEDIWTDFLLAHAPRIRTPAATEAYLRILTLRRCRRLNQLSSRQVPLEASTHEGPSDLPTPEAALIAADEDRRRAARLAECMDQLDGHAVRLLRLRYQGGLTLDSIGERLGVSKQYAGRIVTRATDALRSCVEAA
jgi:RNA polymerase sigma factor (sigma-70 family)